MIKIITAYNLSYKRLVDISYPAIQNNCDYHGFEYEPYCIPNGYDRPPAWAKIQYLLTNLEENTHKYILWMDADTIINNGRYDLLSIIQPSKYIYISKDYNHINTGVMLLKNNEYNKALLYKIWNSTEYLNHQWWEQAAFIKIVQNNWNNIENYIEYIPCKEFHAYTSDLTLRPDSLYDKNTFVVHMPSLPMELRTFRLKELSQNYNFIYRTKSNSTALRYSQDFLESWQQMKNLLMQHNNIEQIELCELMLFRFLQNLRIESARV